MSLTDAGPVATVVDAEEAARARRDKINRIAKWTLPSLVFVLSILAWHLYVTIGEIPHYILPGPLRVAQAVVDDWGLLWPAS